jgi:nicotinate phosphoribosyltransferase
MPLSFVPLKLNGNFTVAIVHGFDLAAQIPEIRQQLDKVCRLRFSDKELDYLATFPFFTPDFIEFLRIYQLDMRFVSIRPKGEDVNCVFADP